MKRKASNRSLFLPWRDVMNFNTQPGPTVRIAVRDSASCPNWRNAFVAAGWRPFGKVAERGGHTSWLFKRGASVFGFSQPAAGRAEQLLQLPASDAAELSALLVTSGVAVPA
jgi:hypothetical protein